MAEARQEKQHISLLVYDEKIDVYVKPDEEEYYRRARDLVTNTYNKYAQVFKGRRSDHTIALLTLVDVGLKYIKESEKNNTAPYDDVLDKLTSEIEDALNSK
jgi:cell division protein ZapA